jgi:hypothetical protein
VLGGLSSEGFKCPLHWEGCTERVKLSGTLIERSVAAALPEPLGPDEQVHFDALLAEKNAVEGAEDGELEFCPNPACALPNLKPPTDLSHAPCGHCHRDYCRRCMGAWEGAQHRCPVDVSEAEAATQRYIDATTVACPNPDCGTRISHWHGHSCRKIELATHAGLLSSGTETWSSPRRSLT